MRALDLPAKILMLHCLLSCEMKARATERMYARDHGQVNTPSLGSFQKYCIIFS